MCVSVKGKHFQKYTSDWIPFIPSVTIRPERVRILTAGTFSGRRSGFVFIAQHKKTEPMSLPPGTVSGLKIYPKCF